MNLAMDPVIAYAGSAILFCMWFIAASLTLTRKYSIKKTVLGVVVGFGIYCLLPLLPLFSGIRFAVGVVVVAVPILILYQEKWYVKLLIAALIMSSMIVAEFLLLILLPIDEYIKADDTEMLSSTYLVYLFTNAVLLTVLTVLVRYIRNRFQSVLNSYYPLLFLLFPFSQYIAICGWFTPSDNKMFIRQPILLLFALLLFLGADILLVFAFQTGARSLALQTRNNLLENQIAMEHEHYAALAANYTDIRRMRHDIDNHLYTIRALLADGKHDEASKYTDQFLQTDLVSAHSLAGCENTVVSSFLIHKKNELEKHGSKLVISIFLPRSAGIPDPDLICALGNLLDNAAEACSCISNAKIQLSVRYKGPYLHISISNPYQNQEEKKSPRIPELSRGLGQDILRHLARQYDGYYQIKQENCTYYADLVLNGSSTDLEGDHIEHSSL